MRASKREREREREVRVRVWEFNIIYVYGLGLGRVCIKPKPISVFFKNPYPTLLFIGPGKIRPIRVKPSQVFAGRAFIAIPSQEIVYCNFI